MNSGLLAGRENETIEGMYPLGRLIAASGDSAIYETTVGEPAEPALIELRHADTSESQPILQRWREAMGLSHPNLIRLYGTGTSSLDGIAVVYLVMERAEESLAGVLAERALSQEETREMLEPALSALTYLHKSGYAHGALEPSTIYAIGETLKLSSEGVRRIGEEAGPADDMFGLGTVLVQALTQNIPNLGNNSEPYILRDIPEPFSGIATHCLDSDPQKRWTAEQALAHLQTAADPLPIPSPPQSEPAAERYVGVQQGPAAVSRVPTSERPRTDNKKWLYGGIAALVAIGMFAVLKKKPDTIPAPPAIVEATNVVAPFAGVHAPPVPDSPPPVRAARPTPFVTRTPSSEKKIVAKSGDRRADGWAVVVAAYGARDPAQKRAREIAKKWPKFKVDVFEPASEKARHLVVLGTNLSENDAETLRQRAVASGLPRDTYVKRFAGRKG